MIPTVFGYSAIDGAYWSLVPEFFFYLNMAFLLLFKNKKNYLFWGIIVLILSATNIYFYTLPKALIIALNLKWGSLFFSGILFYKIKTKDYKSIWQIYLLMILAWLTTLSNLQNNNERFIVSCFYPIFYLFSTEKLNKINWSPLLFIGKISFPLYLLHQNIGYVIMNYTKPYLGHSPILFILLPISIVIVMAYLVHRFIETPSIKYLRSMKNKLRLTTK